MAVLHRPVSLVLPFLFLISIFFLQLLEPVNACSMPEGWYPPTDEEIVLRSGHVIYGRVRRTFDTSTLPSVFPIYSAELIVLCILKGPPVPLLVNFTRVGYIPGMCDSTELQPDHTYAITWEWEDDEGQLIPDRTLPADETKLQELARVCGLDKQYPIGLTEGSLPWTCPEPTPAGQCLDQAYFDAQRPPRPSHHRPPTRFFRGKGLKKRLVSSKFS